MDSFFEGLDNKQQFVKSVGDEGTLFVEEMQRQLRLRQIYRAVFVFDGELFFETGSEAIGHHD